MQIRNSFQEFASIAGRQLRLGLYFLIAFTLLRFIFLGVFLPADLVAPQKDFFKAFFLGFRFDLRLCAVLLFPLFFASFSERTDPFKNALAKKIWSSLYALIITTVLLVYILDFGYFGYLQRRVNATVLNFGENLAISFEMINETYHATWVLFGLLVFAVLLFFGLKKFVFSAQVPGLLSKKKRIFNRFVFFMLLVIGVHGSLNQYPLRWGDAFFSGQQFIADLSLNPVLFLNDTFQFREKKFDVEKVREAYPMLSEYWGVSTPDAKTLNFKRDVQLTPLNPSKPPNVIYIIMESFAAYKTGTWGNKLSPSPYFDEAVKKGVLFENFFVPSEATARSIFTMFTSSPDMSMVTTSTRNPFLVEQNPIVKAFTDYDKFYFIGGSASWGNIRGVLKNNVPDLQLYEEDTLGGPRTDVWGLSDYDLFKATARVLKERTSKKPFFAYIQSASFHRPFTIPEDHGDFEVKKLTPEELQASGFMDEAEYNSFRFSDFSLGHFFDLVAKDPAFENTIFVVHGDHGLPHYNAGNLPDGFKHFGLNRYQVPLLVYAPGLLKPERKKAMASEVDVMPTLAGLTGHPFTFCSMGRNLFAEDKKDRYDFSFAYYSSPLEIQLYDQEYLVRGTPGKVQGIYKYLDKDFKTDLRDQVPEKFELMSKMLQAHYEMARWLNYNNKPGCIQTAQ